MPRLESVTVLPVPTLAVSKLAETELVSKETASAPITPVKAP